jgi:hypothetical protein
MPCFAGMTIQPVLGILQQKINKGRYRLMNRFLNSHPSNQNVSDGRGRYIRIEASTQRDEGSKFLLICKMKKDFNLTIKFHPIPPKM